MNPITHLLVGWTVAQTAFLSRRERAIVTLAGVAPDLDGAGILLDFATGRHPGAGAYAAYHHVIAGKTWWVGKVTTPQGLLKSDEPVILTGPLCAETTSIVFPL